MKLNDEVFRLLNFGKIEMNSICSFTTFLFVTLFLILLSAEILYSITFVDLKKQKSGMSRPKIN